VVSYSIKRLAPDVRLVHAELATLGRCSTALPFKMHKVMKILLLLRSPPLITTFLRNVVGLGTFGTFSGAAGNEFHLRRLENRARSAGYGHHSRAAGPHRIGTPSPSHGAAVKHHSHDRYPMRVFGISVLHYLCQPSVRSRSLADDHSQHAHRTIPCSAEEDGLVHTIKLAAGTLLVASSAS
jgi:hypothetical protein